ncbi:hypothetical protein Mbo2_041 [Rhodococcus phage Mbo2]|uniref:Uncharacterized protein n=1 Tax=Rhodococcus phage Mbo2 TaxID=2936911 RepID=A0A9E7LBM2_9CAUD|nr:hypothetical protein Mbo2_041 [Rhodococcus phage Mbo2]
MATEMTDDRIAIQYSNEDDDPKRYFFTLAFDRNYAGEIQAALTEALREDDPEGKQYEWSMGDQMAVVVMPPRKVIDYFVDQMKEHGLWQN